MTGPDCESVPLADCSESEERLPRRAAIGRIVLAASSLGLMVGIGAGISFGVFASSPPKTLDRAKVDGATQLMVETSGPGYEGCNKPGAKPLIEDPTDCHFWYSCFDTGAGHKAAFRYACPELTGFSESRQRCDWESDVDACTGHGVELLDGVDYCTKKDQAAAYHAPSHYSDTFYLCMPEKSKDGSIVWLGYETHCPEGKSYDDDKQDCH